MLQQQLQDGDSSPAASPSPLAPRPRERHRGSEMVDVDHAEGMLWFHKQSHGLFKSFSSETINVLSSNMSITRYAAGQTIVQKGESGTWFGVLLSGTLTVELPNADSLVIAAGELVGEMAVWQVGAKRSATIKGRSAGHLATMLIEELQTFLVEHPVAGMSLSECKPASQDPERAAPPAHLPVYNLPCFAASLACAPLWPPTVPWSLAQQATAVLLLCSLPSRHVLLQCACSAAGPSASRSRT